MLLVSVISYIDRNTLALLAPTILRETHLSNEQYGYIISAFSVAYMLGNPVWGRILDRIGVRAGMAAAVSLWSLASISHAFAIGLRSFGGARAALGFGEGATFPGGLRTVVQTLPAELRSRGTALAYSGGSLGALITPVIVTPIAAVWGWRGAFWFTGGVGVLWLLLWTVLSRRGPLAESSGAPGDAGAPTAGLSLRWRDRNLWAFVAVYSLGAFPLGFVLYQDAIYLSAVLHQSQVAIGEVLWVPPLGWEVGYFFWGWAIDRFARAGAATGTLQKQFFLLTFLSLPLAAIPLMPRLLPTLAMMFFAMFITAGFIIGGIAHATNVYSTRYAGLLAGLGAGSWSALVALLMPGLGRLFDLHRYGTAFAITSLTPALGLAIWLILNRTPPSEVPLTHGNA
jgi:MFS transporter, ACS family, aldohexuronate transporter